MSVNAPEQTSPQPSVEDRISSLFDEGGPPVDEPNEVSDEPEEPTGEPAIEGEDQQEPESDESPTQDAEPVVELEHLGKKYSVPESLKKAFEANRALGTNATQDVAMLRKAVEVEKLALQATATFQNEAKELNQQLAQLSSYKEQARKIDWTSLTTDQKIDLDRELRNIDSQIAELNGQLESRKTEHTKKFNDFVLHAVAHTEQYMRQKVPGWNDDAGAQLHEYGLSQGIPKEKLTTGYFADPQATHMMWKAQQWDKLQAAKPAVANRANAAPPAVKPGAISGQNRAQMLNASLDKQIKQTKNPYQKERLIQQKLEKSLFR